MKVYIVTSGEYSGYGISAVFIDEDAADAYVDRHNRSSVYNDYRVEVYDTDDVRELPKTEHIAFEVNYHMGGFMGDGWSVSADLERTELPFEDVQAKEVVDPFRIGGAKTHWETWVWAKDAQAAKKIGADRIMPVLAAAEIEFIPPDQAGPFDRSDTPFLNFVSKVTVGDYPKQEWGMKCVPAKDATD